MLVDLNDLKDNPFRDFRVDPIDPAVVDELARSIFEDGFWGGVVCRRNKKREIEIAAGHHRIRAAKAAGTTQAEVFVGDFDDAAMIRVYARENATQRGNTGTAMAGTVASAIHYLAKGILTGTLRQINLKPVDLAKARGHLTDDDGLGYRLISEFFDKKIPGINVASIKQQLANLKASGDYARIIGEIRDEIEAEEREAALALARAEEARRKAEEERRAAEEAQREAEEERRAAAARAKAAKEEAERKRAEETERQAELDRQKAEVAAQLAEKRRQEMEAEAERIRKEAAESAGASDTANEAADKANETEISFDLAGVSKHLKNAFQISVFRTVVTSESIAAILPVSMQADFAAAMVEAARNWNSGKGTELTGAFIRDHAFEEAMKFRGLVRRLDKQEQEEAERTDLFRRMERYQGDFARAMQALSAAGLNIRKLRDANPSVNFPLTREFLNALEDAKDILNELDRRLKHDKRPANNSSNTARRALGSRSR
jgi:ParB-like chromosome segregation protein Spo0J